MINKINSNNIRDDIYSASIYGKAICRRSLRSSGWKMTCIVSSGALNSTHSLRVEVGQRYVAANSQMSRYTAGNLRNSSRQIPIFSNNMSLFHALWSVIMTVQKLQKSYNSFVQQYTPSILK